MIDRAKIENLADQLESLANEISRKSVVTGFDGFIDEMITVVDERQSLSSYSRVETIGQFGEMVKSAAGHSSLREIVITRTDPGGCAINMGDGLASLSVPVTTFATVGDPVHSAFNDFSAKATLHTWGREPGRTLAYEFADGKLMHSAVSQLAEFTPEYVGERLKEGVFQKACTHADLIAFTDWTLFPHMTACWKLIQLEVLSKLLHMPPIFLDLVDPSSRSDSDILEMLDILPSFEECGPTTLGLNQNEANILSRLLGVEVPSCEDMKTSEEQALALRAEIGVGEIVIHGQKYAVSANRRSGFQCVGPYCPKPVKSTGAGDRFNAGYALGMILKLQPLECLTLANASSGYYVRSGVSAGIEELVSFLRDWGQKID